jgi:hypothetical protein
VVPTASYNSSRSILTLTKGADTAITMNSSDAGWNAGETLTCSGFTGDFVGMNGYQTVVTGASASATLAIDTSAIAGTYAGGGTCNDFSEFKLKSTSGSTFYSCVGCPALSGNVTMQYALAPKASDTQADTWPSSGQYVKYAKHAEVPNVGRAFVTTFAAATTTVSLNCSFLGVSTTDELEVIDLFNYRSTTPWISSTYCSGGSIANIPLPDTSDPVSAPYDDNAYDATLDAQTTPITHPPRGIAGFEVRKRQTYRSTTKISFRGVAGATSVSVRMGYLKSDGTYSWELPSVEITCGEDEECAFEMPQSVGVAYWQPTYSNGLTRPPQAVTAN